MRSFWMLALLVAAPALAQDPLAAPVAEEAPEVETAWVVDDIASKRFPDRSSPGPMFVKEAEVQVLYREADRARIRLGDKYGWVPVDAITTQSPMGGMDMEELLRQLEAQGIDVPDLSQGFGAPGGPRPGLGGGPPKLGGN